MKKLKKIKSSCVLAALCYVSEKDEDTVIRICRANGFKDGAGMHDPDWRRAADLLGVSVRGIALEAQPLKQFLKNYPDDLLLVGTCDHLFVVDKGIIFDPLCAKPPGLRRMILQAWRVDKSA